VSETVYNALNLPLTVKDALGKTVSYAYNALGKAETVTDPTGNIKTFTYDSMGRNNRVQDEMNGESFVTFDLLGNVTRLEGPMGAATEYVYDNMGRLLSESTVSGYTKRYEYNERNVRSKITNARNQVREITYDANGRVAGYTAPEGTVSYTYDDNGNVLTVTDRKGTIRRTYDVLNRVASYTDTYGKVIRYEYDAVGNMTKLTYPDGSAVNYTYDANCNLLTVTDWANRVTSYTYDENNRVIGVTKPDGSVTTTVYDNMQRVTSTVERTADGAVITGFEYTYDDLSRIVEEKVLADSIKMCYTYDDLGRVTARSKKTLDGVLISAEVFSHDAAGNVTSACGSCVQYDTNNRLTVFDGNPVYYDRDGNMLDNGVCCFGYDSANRLVRVCDYEYAYNAEDVRIRKLCDTEDTLYTYNTNAKLTQLLTKTTCCTETKYVYGIGLIGEETSNAFKTYHFDFRGSTVAITDASGNITDTFAYDTYGKLIGRTGSSDIIFKYNGRDGVITDGNGLIYMRARYYSPDMRRFVNADIVAGSISDAVTLNRFAYANGNPVSFVDPFGLSVERTGERYSDSEEVTSIIEKISKILDISFEHARILLYAEQWTDHLEVKWTTWDIVKWQTWGGDDFLYSKKEAFISNYKDVIQDAALRYDIPDFLLAGVAYIEFGGDPMWQDDIAYAVRSFDWCGPDWIDEHLTITKRPYLTSFGNTSIQVRRALETLDYDYSAKQTPQVIASLKNPIQNFYIAAKHLDLLRNVDFSGKTASELTDEEVQIIASRYHLGPDCSLEATKGWGYGKDLLKMKDDILKIID